MKHFAAICATVALLVAFGLAMTASPGGRFRRQWVWGDSRNSVAPTTETTSTTVAVTTDSPEYMACVKDCPTTGEYNPVCASNNVTYNNPSQFKCARRCGMDATILFFRLCVVAG